MLIVEYSTIRDAAPRSTCMLHHQDVFRTTLQWIVSTVATTAAATATATAATATATTAAAFVRDRRGER